MNTEIKSNEGNVWVKASGLKGKEFPCVFAKREQRKYTLYHDLDIGCWRDFESDALFMYDTDPDLENVYILDENPITPIKSNEGNVWVDKINVRIGNLKEFKKEAMNNYTQSNDESIKSMESGLNMAYGMEIDFLEKLISENPITQKSNDVGDEFVDYLDNVIAFATGNIFSEEGDDLQIKLLEQVKQKYLSIHQKQKSIDVGDERFKIPTDYEIIKIALIFNDGRLDANELTNMVSMCKLVTDRLYENGDIMIPSSKENKL